MGRLTFKMVVGGLAALAGWAIIEPTNPWTSAHAPNNDEWGMFEVRLLLTVGLLLGLALGALDGWMQGGKVHTLRGAALGALFGCIGIMLGYSIGGHLATSVFGGVRDGIDPVALFSRAFAIAPAGALLGAGVGASTLNARRTWQSLVGGALGGAAGGLLFNVIGSIVGPFAVAMQGPTHGAQVEIGQLPRALAMLAIGAFIGLFIGLIELVSRTAWVRLVLGRNEGKEWPIDAAQTFIGRKEGANIPLFGDPNVAPMHACIIRQGPGQYMLADGGSPIGTFLNGQRVQQVPLFHGATIQVGSFQLQFLMKHGAAPVRGPEMYPGQAYAPTPPQPQPQQVGVAYSPGGLYSGGPAPTSQPTLAYQPQSMPTQAYAAAGFTLAAIDGPLAGQRFPVSQPIEVGREGAGIAVGFDANASRRHATISPSPGGLMVTDLGSTNGTFVNGQRVQTASAKIGDVIKIGATSFRVDAA